jgi:hypothetical protein
VEELDGEAVLYDAQNGAIHRFNSTTFEVWNVCDGTRTSKSMARGVEERYSVGADEALAIVRTALAQLHDKGLLQDEGAGGGRFFDHLKLDSAPVHTNDRNHATATNRSASSAALSAISETGGREVSRRELLGGGVTKAMLAAPMISTFFAAGAYASGPSASAAFGPGGCKTVGYSCAVNSDCCEPDTKTACQVGKCCVQHNESGCNDDSDCCNGPDVCIAGTCQ